MSYKNQVKNSVYEVTDNEIAELLSMPDAVNMYFCHGFIRPGLASWGKDIIYISPAVCEQLAFTMKGKPMTLEHPAGLITKANRDKFMIGAVTEVMKGFDDAYDCRFFIDPKTRDGEEAIAATEWKGEEPPRISHVSCVYQVERWGDGGSLNGVKYDREVLAATMLQLALTEDPRYDGTYIVRNSNDGIDRVEYCNADGGLDSQVENSYNENDKPKGANMLTGFLKKKTEIDGDMMVDTDLGPKSIHELVQIANSSKADKERISALEAQIANSDKDDDKDKSDKDDKDKDKDDKSGDDKGDDKDNQPKNDCDKDNQPKNEDKDDGDDEDKDKDKSDDQPKNSANDLKAQEVLQNQQIFNSNGRDTVIEDNVYAGMARAEADFANK